MRSVFFSRIKTSHRQKYHLDFMILVVPVANALAELPPVAAVVAQHERRHRLVGTPRLQLREKGTP